MATAAYLGGMDRPQVLARFAASHWTVPAIFAMAMALRVALMLLLPQQPYSDGEFYVLRAREMASGMGYQEGGFPTAFWPVGYPALIAGSMMLFGPSLLGPMLVNLVSATVILWLVLWFGRTVGGSEMGARLAALLYAFYPAHIAYTGAPLSETASTAVSTAAFALLIAGRNNWWKLALAGLLFGAATLMRTQMLLFPIGAIVALMIVYRSFGWRDAIKAATVVHVALALVVLPWTLRNERMLGEPVLVSTNGGVALYTGANDQATGDWMRWEYGPLWARSGIPFEQRVEKQVELDKRFKTLAIDWIRENPGRYLALGPKKVALLWLKDGDGFWTLQASYPHAEDRLNAATWINHVYFTALLGLALVCFLIATRAVLKGEEDDAPLGLLLCMPVFVSLLAFIFTGQIRYHYPAMVFVIVAAGWTLAATAPGRLRIRTARTR